jgi:hypothetical protein
MARKVIWPCAFLVIVTFGFSGFAPVEAQQVEPHLRLEAPSQNSAEMWVWDEGRAGRPANLHEHCKADLDPQTDL